MSISVGVKMINQVLATSKTTPNDRRIVCETTETLLRSVGAYFGYRLLFSHEVPEGEAPGRHPNRDMAGGTDSTRREYFTEPSSNRDR